MKSILARPNRDVLEQFAWSNALVALDFDGTLAPIVPEPGRAAMRHSTRRLLRALTRRYPCVVLSGRAQGDIAARLEGAGVHQVVGNHGMDPSKASSGLVAQVQRWRSILEERLSSYSGVAIEDKAFSIALHYRRSREKKKARAAIFAAARSLGDVRIIAGKLVVNLQPPGAPNKGIALERERDRFACDTAIYVGDDESDEDVFWLDQPGRLLTIRVGPKRSSSANYCIKNQAEMDDLLRALIALRSEIRPRDYTAS